MPFNLPDELPDRAHLLPAEAAMFLRIKTHTLYRWISEGKIRAFRTPTGLLRLLREDVLAAIRPEE